MDATRWKRAWELFDLLVDTPPEGRRNALDALEPDPGLREEVLALLDRANAATAPAEVAPPPPSLLAPGTLIGRWRVRSLIGRGGMGEVYLVERTGVDFQQRAALKLMPRMDSQQDRARFAAERRILARLEHPGIAHLLDGGEHGHTPFVVMEYVDGVPLTEYAGGLPLRKRLILLLQACEAVGHAHRHLVVHRDLKPGNILVTAQGQLKLLDFGIAKHLGPEPGTDAEATQAIRASPDYCAPEQLNGGAISTATDVYALGVIMFELLTGERPWKLAGLPLVRALERLSLQDPPAPSSRLRGPAARALRGDLDNIVRKALQPEPERRYRTTDELAEDIRAWLDQRPVKARKPTLAYVWGRAFRRHRLAFALGAVALASVAAGITGVVLQGREAALERDLARREVARNAAVRQYMALMFRAAGELQGNSEVSARDVLARAAEQLGERFHADPQAHADISLELAGLFLQLNDYTGARPLLEHVVARGDDIAPPVRALALHDLAQISFRQGQQDVASELLAQAQAFWTASPQRYASELLDSRLLQSQLERAAGNPGQALRTLQEALPLRMELSGGQDHNTAVLLNNLGIAHFQVGQLQQATSQYRRAHQLWRHLGMHQSPDALNTLNNWAAAEARLGRPEAAVDLMEQALALRRELYGPSAAKAALMNNLGKTLSQLGRHEDAIPLLQSAIGMGQEHAGGETGPIAVAATLGLAESLAGAGRTQEAYEGLERIAPLIHDAYGSAHIFAAMLDLVHARVDHAAGRRDAARAALARARDGLEALGAAGAAQLEQLNALEARWNGREGVAQVAAQAQPAAAE